MTATRIHTLTPADQLAALQHVAGRVTYPEPRMSDDEIAFEDARISRAESAREEPLSGRDSDRRADVYYLGGAA